MLESLNGCISGGRMWSCTVRIPRIGRPVGFYPRRIHRGRRSRIESVQWGYDPQLRRLSSTVLPLPQTGRCWRHAATSQQHPVSNFLLTYLVAKISWCQSSITYWWRKSTSVFSDWSRPSCSWTNKKLSCRREIARSFLSLTILLRHSREFKVIRNDTCE